MESKKLIKFSLILFSLIGCNSNSSINSSTNLTNSSISSSKEDLLPIKIEKGTKGTISILVDKGNKEAYQEVLYLYNEYAESDIHFDVYERKEGTQNDFKDFPDIYSFNSLEYHDLKYSRLYDSNNEELKNYVRGLYKNDLYCQLLNDESITAFPYSFSTNVLYYNKKLVSDEEVKSFEGLSEAAKKVSNEAKQVKSIGYVDNSMHYFATTFLAKKYDDASTSLVLSDTDSSLCGDDVISTTKWMNEYYLNENGYKRPSSEGYEYDMFMDENGISNMLSLVAPATKEYYERMKMILGDDLGVTSLPSFIINEKYGSVDENTKFKGGTFANINYYGISDYMDNKEKRIPIIESVIAFLVSKRIQELLYDRGGILPCYEGAELIERSDNISKAQMEMKKYSTLYPISSTFYIRFDENEYLEIFYESLIYNKNVSTYEEIKNTLKKAEEFLNTGKKPILN